MQLLATQQEQNLKTQLDESIRGMIELEKYENGASKAQGESQVMEQDDYWNAAIVAPNDVDVNVGSPTKQQRDGSTSRVKTTQPQTRSKTPTLQNATAAVTNPSNSQAHSQITIQLATASNHQEQHHNHPGTNSTISHQKIELHPQLQKRLLNNKTNLAVQNNEPIITSTKRKIAPNSATTSQSITGRRAVFSKKKNSSREKMVLNDAQQQM